MMCIEHFVSLAEAYNLGFFYFYFLFFKLLCVRKDEKHFLIFKTVVNTHKRETVKHIPPGFKFKSGYPRHLSLVTNRFTCNKLRVLCLTKPGA